MFIELAEVLVCPACLPCRDEGALQGLVAVVEELEDRKIIDGWLGCPVCEARYPIKGGEVSFAPAAAEAPGPPGAAPPTITPPSGPSGRHADLALLVAALLALHEEAGYVLLGEGLGEMAEGLSKRAPASEIVALRGPDEKTVSEPSAGVSRLSDTTPGSLPLRAASVAAAALPGEGEETIAEAARVLKPGGRLALLGSAPERKARVLHLLRARGLEPIVVDPQAIVARRV